MTSRLIRLGAGLAVAAGALACGSTGTSSSNHSPVVIGGFVYTQGSLKAFGDTGLWGIQTAVNEANAAGGILGGRKIQLNVYDEGLNATDTVTSIRKAKADGAVGLVGFLDATAGTAAAAESERLKLPIVIAGSGTGTFVYHNQRKDLVHVLTYPEADDPGLDNWIINSGAKTVVQIAYDSDYSHVSEKTHRRNLANHGITFPPTIYVPYGQADVSQAAAQAVALHPDVVIFDIWGDATVGGVKRMAELGFKGSAITCAPCMDDGEMKSAGSAVGQLSYYDTEYYWPDRTISAGATFLDGLNKINGASLGGQTETFYEGAKLLIQAIDKAGTTSDRQKIGDAMHSVNFMTPRGAPMEVLPDGQVYNSAFAFVKWDYTGQARKLVQKLELPKSYYAEDLIFTS